MERYTGSRRRLRDLQTLREVVCTWVFAEADGFNPSSMLKVSRSTEDGRPFESIGWKYLSSNGIYVPSYYKRTVFDRQTLGVLSSRTLTLEDSEVGRRRVGRAFFCECT